jgi:putative oxidoreductase
MRATSDNDFTLLESAARISLRRITMQNPLCGVIALVGRLFLVTIFLTSALMNKIPNFAGVAKKMAEEGVPAPTLLLVGAIVFLIVGSLSVLVGYKARIGATLLLVFLVLATYYFHDFWTMPKEAAEMQMIQFMKNLALMGAMLFIIGNGAGAMSLDAKCEKRGDGGEHQA